MTKVIDMFSRLEKKKRKLEDKPMPAEEVLARLLGNIAEAVGLMLQLIPACEEKLSDEEKEQTRKASRLVLQAQEHAWRVFFMALDTWILDKSALVAAWSKFGPEGDL